MSCKYCNDGSIVHYTKISYKRWIQVSPLTWESEPIMAGSMQKKTEELLLPYTVKCHQCGDKND